MLSAPPRRLSRADGWLGCAHRLRDRADVVEAVDGVGAIAARVDGTPPAHALTSLTPMSSSRGLPAAGGQHSSHAHAHEPPTTVLV